MNTNIITNYCWISLILEFLRQKVLDEAIRQTQAANAKGLTVEWLVSDQTAVDQLTRFFAEKNVSIIVKFLAE